MKKNIILFSFYGRSGMWHYATQFANGMSIHNKTHLICPRYANKSYVSKKVFIKTLSSSHNILKFFFETLNIFQHIRILNYISKNNSKVVHFLDNHPWSILYMLYFKLLNYKIIVTLHDPLQHSGEPRAFIQNLINSCQIKLSNKIIVHGIYLKNQLAKTKNIEVSKIIVFPHGHYDFIKQFDNSKIKPEKNTFLFFGRIVKYKGLDLLLDSIDILIKKKYKNFKLIIAGSGDLIPYKNKINQVKDYLEITNKYLDESEIPNFFKKCEFVVLPYIDATQTGIIPIAYAYKKPVLITNVGALPEVVDQKKTGYIVNPTAEDLAKGLMYMLKEKGLRKIGENAYIKMNKTLDWGNNIKKILREYN